MPIAPLHLYIHRPAVVLSGQVNMASVSYPVDTVVVDNLSGAIELARPGQTVVFGTQPGHSDLGVQRIRKIGIAGQLFIGRSSRGRNPGGGADEGRWGEVDLADNIFFEVWDDRRVWAKIPAILPDGDGVKIYKDGDVEVATWQNEPHPVANGGVGFGGTIAPITNVVTVAFDSADSFAVHTGATIASVLWDVADGTIVTGTSTSAAIIATFPAGFRYVALTVTDSEDHTHTTHIPVVANDPANPITTLGAEVLSHTLTPHGAELSIRITQPLDALDYPDGTLVMLWEGEPSGAADRSHMRFVGWHAQDPGDIQAGRTGTLSEVTLECHDVAGRLRELPGFAQEVRNVATGDANRWYLMANANIDKYLVYLLHWHSTALEVSPFVWSGTGDTYALSIIGSDAASLFEQAQRVCQAMIPARHLTCDSRGALVVRVDPLLQDTADRTVTVQRALTAADWTAIRAPYMRPPKVRTLRTGALLTGTAAIPTPLFAIAPGTAPGQGPDEHDRESQAGLVPSQSVLNSATGHAYARANANTGHFAVPLAADGWPAIEPAHMTWVELTIPADVTTPRLRAGTARTLPHSVTLRYDHARTGVLRTAEVTLELETEGVPATTVLVDISGNPPADEDEWWGGEPGDYWDDNFPVEPPSPFYGDPHAYIMWDGAHIFRTWDIMESSPTWEFVDTGVTGALQDGRYVIKGDGTVGMWMMTQAGIWWCADIMASTPAWANVLPVATVQASDPVPDTGVVVCQAMAPYDSHPGALAVATGPNGNETSNNNYAHSIYWQTTDYGATWASIDMADFGPPNENDFLFLTSVGPPAVYRGFCFTPLFGMETFRSSPVVWCMRAAPRIGATTPRRVVTRSGLTNGPLTVNNYALPSGSNNNQDGAFLHPFPALSDYAWLHAGTIGTSNRPDLFRSTDVFFEADGFTTQTQQMTDNGVPTGYGGVSGLWRPNKRTFDPNHVMAWFRHTATTHFHLLESSDAGATWSLLWNSGLTDINIPGTPFPTGIGGARFNTPNGWPANDQMWALVRAHVTSGSITGVIQMTTDHFGSLQSKVGNLDTLITSTGWVNGVAGGFFLPKVPPNV